MTDNESTGWAIKVTGKVASLNGINSWFVISKNKNGSGFKGGTDISMAKVYKSKNTALKIGHQINTNEQVKIELIEI